ncbi:MAG: hypothetical protein AB7N53_15680, partial [Candidatus Binatia bacterium]
PVMAQPSSPRLASRAPTALPVVVAGLFACAWMALRWPLPEWMLRDNDWLHQLGGANQILRGEHPFIDWRTDFGPLRYYPSALAQLLLGERTLSELLLVTVAYTAAYAMLFRYMWLASGRLPIAAALLFVSLMLAPRLFKYYVMLGPVLCLGASWRYIDRPGRASLAWLAAAVTLTGLFRIDFGAYAALAAVVTIATEPAPARARLLQVVRLCGYAALFASPWLVWLAVRGGIDNYLLDTFSNAPRHAAAMSLPFPRFDWSAPLLAPGNALALLYLCFYSLPLIAVVAAAGLHTPGEHRAWRKVVCTAALAQAVLLHAAHRSGYSHLLQSIPICFVLLAWLAGRAWPRGRTLFAASRPALVGTAALAIALGVAAWGAVRVGGWPSRQAGRGLAAFSQHGMPRSALVDHLAATHPDDPLLGAIEYVRRCTEPTDHLIALPPWIGVYYFADRKFAGGQPVWSPGFFSTDLDQRRWIDTVRRQRPALAIGDGSYTLDGRPERRFATYSHLVMQYVLAQYAPIGSFGPIALRARPPVDPASLNAGAPALCFRDMREKQVPAP